MTGPTLPPDRLRAMARAIDPEAFVEAKRGWRTGVDAWAEHLRQLEARRAKALAAAQACWEASPGGELMEALRNADLSLTANIKKIRAGGFYSGQMADALDRTLAALRQALPQGTET